MQELFAAPGVEGRWPACWAGHAGESVLELGVTGLEICGKSEHLSKGEVGVSETTSIRRPCSLSTPVAPLVPYRLVKITKAILKFLCLIREE